MSNQKPAPPDGKPDLRPEAQQDEAAGRIKSPQQTDRTMAGKDLARGSEPATHARK